MPKRVRISKTHARIGPLFKHPEAFGWWGYKDAAGNFQRVCCDAVSSNFRRARKGDTIILHLSLEKPTYAKHRGAKVQRRLLCSGFLPTPTLQDTYAELLGYSGVRRERFDGKPGEATPGEVAANSFHIAPAFRRTVNELGNHGWAVYWWVEKLGAEQLVRLKGRKAALRRLATEQAERRRAS